MSVDQSPLQYRGRPSAPSGTGPANLADLLERILDKGIVIAGDVSVRLVDIELLTIKLRLLIASVDKAREIGVNWWESDPWLSGRARDQREIESPPRPPSQRAQSEVDRTRPRPAVGQERRDKPPTRRQQ